MFNNNSFFGGNKDAHSNPMALKDVYKEYTVGNTSEIPNHTVVQEIKDPCLCPRCDKDITLDEINNICTAIDNNTTTIENSKLTNEVITYLNKYRRAVKN